jgi:hypothetical protein
MHTEKHIFFWGGGEGADEVTRQQHEKAEGENACTPQSNAQLEQFVCAAMATKNLAQSLVF